MYATRLALVSLSLLASGCAVWPPSSKWASGNAEYAEKYDRPYPSNDAKRISRMAKQAVDARHVKGMSGGYAGVAMQDDPFALGAELGFAHYPESWLETRASLAGVIAGVGDEADEELGQNAFLGANAGVRVNSPSRVAPFIGAGAYGGMSWFVDDATADGLDNDDDLLVDEPGETDWNHDFLLAVYPEVGLHVWLTEKWRLTGSAAYYVTTEGRDRDFWFYGISLGWFADPQFSDGYKSPHDDPVFRIPPP